MHVQQGYFSLFNQSYHRFVALLHVRDGNFSSFNQSWRVLWLGETLQTADISSMEENRCSRMLNSSEAGISSKRKLLSEKYSTLHLLVMMANITEQGFVFFCFNSLQTSEGWPIFTEFSPWEELTLQVAWTAVSKRIILRQRRDMWFIHRRHSQGWMNHISNRVCPKITRLFFTRARWQNCGVKQWWLLLMFSIWATDQ